MRQLLAYCVALAVSLPGAAGAQEIDLYLLAPEETATQATEQPAVAPATGEDDAIIAPVQGELSDYLSDATGRWALEAGESIQPALERWAREAQYTLLWATPKTYYADARSEFPVGTDIKDAVRLVMRGLYATNRNIKARVYRNRVIRITDGGEE